MHDWRADSRKNADNKTIKVKLVNPDSGKLVWNSSGVWGPSKDGGLNENKVRETRTLLKQCTGLTPEFTQLLAAEAKQIGMDGSATLAVHLRLTDKLHSEAKENADLSNETIVGKIKLCMGKLGCTTVFFVQTIGPERRKSNRCWQLRKSIVSLTRPAYQTTNKLDFTSRTCRRTFNAKM